MTDYLAHYGRKGMKWGKHIFGDKLVTTVDGERQSVRDDDLEGRRRRMAANQAAAKSITTEKRRSEAAYRKANFQGKAALDYGYKALSDANTKMASQKKAHKVIRSNVVAATSNKGARALGRMFAASIDDMAKVYGKKRALGRQLIRNMGITKAQNVATKTYYPNEE